MVNQLINEKVLSTLEFVLIIRTNPTNLKKKISRGIGHKIRQFVDTKTLVQLYRTIILPFLSYDCIVWSNTYDYNVKQLQIIQRKAIRLITFSNFDAHTSPLLLSLTS